jgi:hypothetical protein
VILDRPDRLAGFAIEGIRKILLRRLHDDGHWLAIDTDVE